MYMDKNNYVMTPADREAHLMPITQIISDAFAGGGYIEEISKKYVGGCHYDFDTTRLIWDGGQLVHHWGVWGYDMRLDEVLLKAAGIGAVVTLEDYRQQGLMQQAALDSFDAMYANGYDLTILRGRHYHKFGYRRAWNYVTTRLKPEEIPQIELEVGYRPLGPAELDELNALYNHEYAGFSGTCVRPTYPMLTEGEMNAYGWEDEAGQLVGYVRAVPTEDKTALQCLEAAGDPRQGLAILAKLFREGEYGELHFFTLPQQHSMLQIVRRGSCIVEDRYFYHTGWQVKIINLPSCLNKLRPVFERRLAASQFAGWRGSLQLIGGDQQAVLEISEGEVQVKQYGSSIHTLDAGYELGRLIVGSDAPAEIFQQAGITCGQNVSALVEVLFPRLYPMMSQWDEF